MHRELGKIRFSDLRRIGASLNRYPGPRRILVQWVPHAYGYKSLNLLFCLWLWLRNKSHGDQVELIAHEVFLPFRRWDWRQNAVALGHRLMTVVLMNCSTRVWVSTQAWTQRLSPYALGRSLPFIWLPVPSNIPASSTEQDAQLIRRRYAPDGQKILGHFGTFGKYITEMLTPSLLCLLRERRDLVVLLLGRESAAYREELSRQNPDIALRLHATGELEAEAVSQHIQACDALFQPFPDGVSSRRTSAMVGIAHGRAIVTTRGTSTEPIWSESGAVEMQQADNHSAIITAVGRLLDDPARTARLGQAAKALYESRFTAGRIAAMLRESR